MHRLTKQETLDRVREFLATADLAYADKDDVAEAVGLPYNTIYYRLSKLGTTWKNEKRAERVSRLKRFLAGGGRLSVDRGTDAVGFTDTDSFLHFFRQVMGMTVTEYRQAQSVELVNFPVSHETTGVRA